MMVRQKRTDDRKIKQIILIFYFMSILSCFSWK